MRVRDAVKEGLGRAVVASRPAVRFENTVFSLSHMRAGTTALSNVLCSHPAFSGYGEAHIVYDSDAALGKLLVNQAIRRQRKPGATYLHDKVLHDRYTLPSSPRFFLSRAIFIVREPLATIESIRRLFDAIGSDEYPTDSAAADYYLRRVTHLQALWDNFPEERRIAFRAEDVLGHPDDVLRRLSAFLDLPDPLVNRYESPAASRRRGGGDPLTSGQHSRILPVVPTTPEPVDLTLPRETVDALRDVHLRAVATFGC